MRIRSTLTPTVLLLSLLSGCAVGPDYGIPAMELPATWNSNKTRSLERPPELALWWTRLNDPILNEYIERAAAGNLTVASARTRVQEARATVSQETGTLLPSVDGSSSAMRSGMPSATAASAASTVSTQWKAGFDASWELDLFGGRKRSVEAARYGLDAANEDLRNTMLVLIGDVASNYADVRGAQARLALAYRTAGSLRQTASLTKAKADAGTATAADVARAQALLASTEAGIPSIEIARATAVHRLGVLLGQPPAALFTALEKRRPIPKPGRSVSVGIPADVLLSRPDVRLAERQLAQATARVGVAEAARYPSLRLTGDIASQALTIGDLASKSTISWAIGPALSIPIFRGGQLKAAVEASKARNDAAAVAYQAAVLSAMEDVENAIVALNQNRIRSAKLASAVSSYRTATDASRIQYETGSLDYLNLLDAQRAQYDAEAALIESQLAVTKAYIALNKALGGGWSQEPATVAKKRAMRTGG